MGMGKSFFEADGDEEERTEKEIAISDQNSDVDSDFIRSRIRSGLSCVDGKSKIVYKPGNDRVYGDFALDLWNCFCVGIHHLSVVSVEYLEKNGTIRKDL